MRLIQGVTVIVYIAEPSLFILGFLNVGVAFRSVW